MKTRNERLFKYTRLLSEVGHIRVHLHTLSKAKIDAHLKNLYSTLLEMDSEERKE